MCKYCKSPKEYTLLKAGEFDIGVLGKRISEIYLHKEKSETKNSLVFVTYDKDYNNCIHNSLETEFNIEYCPYCGRSFRNHSV